MANLIDSVGVSVAGAVAPQAAALGPGSALLPKLVFQPSEHPIVVDRSQYEGAASPTHPEGDYIKLYRQSRDLIDPLPLFQREYAPSFYSFEQTFEHILFGANLGTDAPDSERLYFGAARQAFIESSLPSLAQGGGHYHAAYAAPDDWYDVSKVTEQIVIEPDSPSPVAGLPTIGSASGSAWRFPGLPGSMPVSGDSSIKKISLKFRYIRINRPWFNPLMLLEKHWSLDDLEAGQISTGSLENNPGLMPLIPIGFVVATDITIEADWKKDDEAVVKLIQATGSRTSLGPFVFGSGTRTPKIDELSTILPMPTVDSLLAEPDAAEPVVDLPAFQPLDASRFRMDDASLRALGVRKKTFGLSLDPDDPEPIEWHLPGHHPPSWGHVPPPPTLDLQPSNPPPPLVSRDLQIIGWVSILVPYWPVR